MAVNRTSIKASDAASAVATVTGSASASTMSLFSFADRRDPSARLCRIDRRLRAHRATCALVRLAQRFTPSPRRGEGGVRGFRHFRIAPPEPPHPALLPYGEKE